MWGRRRREGEGGPSDGESYMDLARCIADEERRKHHTAPPTSCFVEAFDQLGVAARWEERLVDKAPPSADVSAMQPFSTYVGSIERLVGTVLSSGFDGLHIQTTRALNGEPGEALRESIDLGTRRSIGAFFSGSGLSDELVGTFNKAHKWGFTDSRSGLWVWRFAVGVLTSLTRSRQLA